jgi:hypothetical protein
VFDNRPGFPKGFANLLSSLVTGSGDSKRELYTTDTEYAFKVKRPVFVNGINVPSDRADLLSRFVSIEVPPISEKDRISEAEFWASFERERGKLLGAFFDILSGVLRNRKPVDWRPRMSDWGELVSALYDYMGWGRDMFKLDHEQVELKQHDAALEAIAGAALMQYLYSEFDDGKSELVLPKADLYLEVKLRVEPDSRRWFPQSSAAFGKELVRLKQALAAKGFEVSDGWIGNKNNKQRAAKIVRIDEEGTAGNSSKTRLLFPRFSCKTRKKRPRGTADPDLSCSPAVPPVVPRPADNDFEEYLNELEDEE